MMVVTQKIKLGLLALVVFANIVAQIIQVSLASHKSSKHNKTFVAHDKLYVPILESTFSTSEQDEAFGISWAFEWIILILYSLFTLTFVRDKIGTNMITFQFTPYFVGYSWYQWLVSFLAGFVKSIYEISGVIQLSLFVARLKEMQGSTQSTMSLISFIIYLCFHNVTRLALRDVNFALFPVTEDDKGTDSSRLTEKRRLSATVSVGDWFSHMIFRQLIPCLLFFGFTHKTSVFGVGNTHIAANLFRLFWVVIFCYFSFRTTGEWMGDTMDVLDFVLRDFLSKYLFSNFSFLKDCLKKEKPNPKLLPDAKGQDQFTFNGSKHERIEMLPRAETAFQI